MKLNYLLVLSLLMGLAVSCSSNKKEVVKEPPAREFKPTYIVRDASNPRVPEWITEPQAWSKKEDSGDAKDFRYFASEITELEKNKRLCLKSAEARATARIASEIVQFIKNSYAESTESDSEEFVTKTDTLAQEIQSFVTGAIVHRTYWEQRSYKQELGADEDATGFVCSALVKINRKTVEKAVERAAKKIVGELENAEIKENAKKALKDAAKKFDELEKPVKIDTQEE